MHKPNLGLSKAEQVVLFGIGAAILFLLWWFLDPSSQMYLRYLW
jgi:hypothetical protein